MKGAYFATGRAVPQIKDNDEWNAASSFALKDAITDTPIHIIKAYNFKKSYSYKTASTFLKPVSISCVSMLAKDDRRGKFAWPHKRTDGFNVFRLDDHIWIWKALDSLHDLDMWEGYQCDAPITPSHAVQRDHLDEEDDEDEDVEDSEDDQRVKSQVEEIKLMKTYDPTQVRKQILLRFTILENDVTQQRVLAVTRSTQQTRYLFHARDTALFYGAHWDCFSSNQDLWLNTVRAQRLHGAEDEAYWDNAIRYGLGIIMGINGFSIGGLQSRRLVQRAVNVLLSSTSPNGFFPGQLDGTNQQPTLFHQDRSRDPYFHASFEVPYILLAYANLICETYDRKTPDFVDLSPLSSLGKHSDIVCSQSEPNPLATGSLGHRSRQVELKKVVHFGSETHVQQRNIVEMTEEWLYHYPAFLANDKNGEVPISLNPFLEHAKKYNQRS